MDRQPKRNGFIDWKQMNQDAEKILEGIDMKIPPKMIVSTLSVAQRQMVEIAKAVSLAHVWSSWMNHLDIDRR